MVEGLPGHKHQCLTKLEVKCQVRCFYESQFRFNVPSRLEDAVCSSWRYKKKTHLNLGLTFGEPWENIS